MLRKIKADSLFTGKEMLNGDHVLLLSQSGTVEAIVNLEEAGEGVETFSGIISPGFINCHCHLDLSQMKGRIPEKTGLMAFVRRVMASRYLSTREELNKYMFLAADEMFRNGIVAVGDICTGTASLEVKKFGSMKWVNFIEVAGFSEADAQMRFDAALETKRQFEIHLSGQPAYFSPHAPYSVSPKLMQILNVNSKGEIITIHNQESREEDTYFKNKTGALAELYADLKINVSDFSPTGKSSLMSWLPFFRNDQRIISVHNTFSDTDDIEYTKLQTGNKNNFHFCLCPSANLYIEDAIPPVDKLQQAGVSVVLGTDSLASNHKLSILYEMQLLKKQFDIPVPQLLQWATLNGAVALGLDDELGSFDEGKRPGVLLLKNFSGDLSEALVSRLV